MNSQHLALGLLFFSLLTVESACSPPPATPSVPAPSDAETQPALCPTTTSSPASAPEVLVKQKDISRLRVLAEQAAEGCKAEQSPCPAIQAWNEEPLLRGPLAAEALVQLIEGASLPEKAREYVSKALSTYAPELVRNATLVHRILVVAEKLRGREHGWRNFGELVGLVSATSPETSTRVESLFKEELAPDFLEQAMKKALEVAPHRFFPKILSLAKEPKGPNTSAAILALEDRATFLPNLLNKEFCTHIPAWISEPGYPDEVRNKAALASVNCNIPEKALDLVLAWLKQEPLREEYSGIHLVMEVVFEGDYRHLREKVFTIERTILENKNNSPFNREEALKFLANKNPAGGELQRYKNGPDAFLREKAKELLGESVRLPR